MSARKNLEAMLCYEALIVIKCVVVCFGLANRLVTISQFTGCRNDARFQIIS